MVRSAIEQEFPGLSNSRWYLKSPKSTKYQCIGWAACESHRKWWPWDWPRHLYPPEVYWPAHLPVGDESIQNFVNAFVDELGYESCGRNEEFEFGYQKIAIYAKIANGADKTKHMARQHLLGRGWLSKLGGNVDILHASLRDLEGDLYGKVEQVLRRSWRTAFSKGLALPSSFRFLLYRLRHPSWIVSNLKRRFLA